MLWGGGVDIAPIVRYEPMELPMQTLNNLSRSLIALEPASTLIAVIEMSLSSWLVAGIVPGIERQPLKKLAVDESALRGCCIDGGRKRRKQDAGSNALSLPSRPAVTGSGWHAGSRRAALRPTSFTPRVWRCRASIGERRPTVSTPSCSNVLFSAGCAASVITARWSRSPH